MRIRPVSPPNPERVRAPQSQPDPKKKKRRRFGVLRRLITFVSALVLMAGLGGGAFAWHIYNRYAAELPSLDGLRQYQPKVMSRLYAGDGRLLSELATERRIFVPISAIPDQLKQAFISAEDQKFWSH